MKTTSIPGPTLLDQRTRHLFKQILAILCVSLGPEFLGAADLQPETLKAWDTYVHQVQMRMEERSRGQVPFLRLDEAPELAGRVHDGEIFVEPVGGESPLLVPRGLIHDWVGAVFVPKVRPDEVMGVLSDYERYADFYRPMVVKSQLLGKQPDREFVRLLMIQKAYRLTAAVEADDEIHVVRLDADRAYSLSISIHVREIADYGKPNQNILPQDQGSGYVWRMFTVTCLEHRDGGTYVEIEMIALSRGIPWPFGWLMQPLTERLPRTILAATLRDTRDAVGGDLRVAPMTRKPH